MKDEIISRRTWFTQRAATITREHRPDGEIQFTVRVSDTGRVKPFIENSFSNPGQAESFLNRIRRESEVPAPTTDKEYDVEYMDIDVHCMICKESIKPSETDMELFRLGFPVHNEQTKPECVTALEAQLREEVLS